VDVLSGKEDVIYGLPMSITAPRGHLNLSRSLRQQKIRQTTFDAQLERARLDAKDVNREEADRRVGCLVMVPGQATLQTQELVDHFDGLCARADIAFRIGGGVGSVWLAFAFVE